MPNPTGILAPVQRIGRPGAEVTPEDVEDNERQAHSKTTMLSWRWSAANASINLRLLDFSSSRPMLEFMAFGNDKALQRGIPLASVMRQQASVFNTSAGTEETYGLSTPISRNYGVFISHNWAVARWRKFLVFAMLFNSWLAAAVSLAVQVTCVVLTATGRLPTIPVSWSPYPRGVLCRALSAPVFLLLLLFGGELRRCCPCFKGPMAFLDKTCVSQANDVALRKRGKERMGAFLAHSRTMLALYTDIYFMRLWTLYEFACFLCLHPVSRVQLVPTYTAQTAIFSIPFLYLFQCLLAVVEVWSGFYFILYGCLLLFAPCLAWVARGRARQRHEIRLFFENFSVCGCSCECDEDRPLIYKNIALLMRAQGAVAVTAPQSEALAAFDGLLKLRLPQIIDVAMGRNGFTYREALVWVWMLLPYQLDKLAGLGHGMPWSYAIADTLVVMTFLFCIFPVALCVLSRLSQVYLHRRGPLEAVIACLAAWAGALYAALCHAVLDLLVSTSQSVQDSAWSWHMGFTFVCVFANLCVCLWAFGYHEYMLEWFSQVCKRRRGDE